MPEAQQTSRARAFLTRYANAVMALAGLLGVVVGIIAYFWYNRNQPRFPAPNLNDPGSVLSGGQFHTEDASWDNLIYVQPTPCPLPLNVSMSFTGFGIFGVTLWGGWTVNRDVKASEILYALMQSGYPNSVSSLLQKQLHLNPIQYWTVHNEIWDKYPAFIRRFYVMT
jgi:hypothetical protein